MKPNDGLRLQLWYADLFQKAKSVLRRCVHAFFQTIGSIYSLENRFRRLMCISFLAMVPTDPMELLAFRTVSDQSDLTTSSPVNLLLSFCSASTVWCWSPFGRFFLLAGSPIFRYFERSPHPRTALIGHFWPSVYWMLLGLIWFSTVFNQYM